MRCKPHPYPFLDQITEALQPFQPGAAPANDNAGPVTWDEYFHAIAQAVALKSKDKNKKVGAVVVSAEGNTILSTGFNGFARGIRETPEREHEDEKLFWVTHAETNAIFNAARHGISLVGGTLYVTLFPCSGCAQAIVQAGIKRVFSYGKYWIKTDPEPTNRWEIALDLFAEGRVAVDTPNIRWGDVGHWEERKRRENAEEAAAKAKAAEPNPNEPRQ